ncbi:hypothetical protein WA026_005383 [Henosepilachna vigintioctopunctata]|uniref:Lipase n=1 Tax=Henosepilachna vigintioctopunctata TaxID=420089 RepID=A0AAW1TSQ2_9CUCU
MSTIEECCRISNFVKDSVQKRGYPLEVHSVTTEDGYINSLFRIPHGKDTDTFNKLQRKPVLLVHGLLASCADWVNLENGLGYFLVDNGYDVWLANCRGTTFSRGHVSLDFQKNAAEYWDFSWHEIGYYDVAAFIDHVLSITQFSKLLYIGHSQGATAVFVLTSTKQEYNDKISLCCALAPAVVFDKAKLFPMKLMANICQRIQALLNFFHVYPSSIPFGTLTRCIIRQGESNSFSRRIALLYLALIAGHADIEQTTKMELSTIGVTTVNSASWRQFIHYCQCIQSRKFAQYDFGKPRNEELYNSICPPEYDLLKVTVPVAIFYGKNDVFFHAEDIISLTKKLGNVVHKYEIEWKLFNHMDFLYANDSVTLAYKYILDMLQIYK